MAYDYSGYLKGVIDPPDPTLRESLACVEFSADDMAQWSLRDDETEREWQHIPVSVERSKEGVRLKGGFEEVRRIDNLDKDDPSFWVPLSTLGWSDPRFPIDVARYSIIEITYRCHSAKARPAWQWHYDGGVHFDGLPPTREWRTLARRIPHFGFPSMVTRLTLRLYSTGRSTETVEVQSIRFRMATQEEEAACNTLQTAAKETDAPPHYPLLDEGMPLGVFMHAGTAKRMAESMEIDLSDYWRLALEDVTRHFHNSVAMQGMDEISPGEWRGLLDMAESFGIRLVVMHDWCMDDFAQNGAHLVEKYIEPYADSDAILAYAAADEPPDHSFQAHLQARRLMEVADPKHPLVCMMRDPNSFPLYKPFFAASGMSYFRSHAPWNVAELVRTHQRLSGGQQFWLQAPAFVYGTDTPRWSTCPEMRLMLNHAIANGIRGWFTYTYHNDPIWMGGHCQRSLTGPFLTFSDLWSELGNRVQRLRVMAPLYINATPTDEPEIEFGVHWEKHARARHPDDRDTIQHFWLQGEDYALLYIVSNDIGEVNPVRLEVPGNLPKGLEVYDLTDFTRSRVWAPMERDRSLNMFPGQGQIVLVAEPEVCEYWRDIIVARILEGDRRQLDIDMALAERYGIDLEEDRRALPSIGEGTPLDDLHKMRDLRDHLINLIYDTPALVEPRSKLIEASAGVCACDGALCRLLGAGKADPAHEMGIKVLPLARELAHLRLRLRGGFGPAINEASAALAQRTAALAAEIRAMN